MVWHAYEGVSSIDLGQGNGEFVFRSTTIQDYCILGTRLRLAMLLEF